MDERCDIDLGHDEVSCLSGNYHLNTCKWTILSIAHFHLNRSFAPVYVAWITSLHYKYIFHSIPSLENLLSTSVMSEGHNCNFPKFFSKEEMQRWSGHGFTSTSFAHEIFFLNLNHLKIMLLSEPPYIFNISVISPCVLMMISWFCNLIYTHVFLA